jgi:hypothetical protein
LHDVFGWFIKKDVSFGGWGEKEMERSCIGVLYGRSHCISSHVRMVMKQGVQRMYFKKKLQPHYTNQMALNLKNF